jgi:hypothetical protein
MVRREIAEPQRVQCATVFGGSWSIAWTRPQTLQAMISGMKSSFVLFYGKKL